MKGQSQQAQQLQQLEQSATVSFRKRKRRASGSTTASASASASQNRSEADECDDDGDHERCARERLMALREVQKIRRLISPAATVAQTPQMAAIPTSTRTVLGLQTQFRAEQGGASGLDRRMEQFVEDKLREARDAARTNNDVGLTGSVHGKNAVQVLSSSEKREVEEQALYEIPERLCVQKEPACDPQQSVPTTVQQVHVPPRSRKKS